MPSGLIDAYPFSTDRYDEMLCGPGAPRPHWNAFVQRIEGLSSQAMRQRAGFVADAIAADGVTYNVYADPEGMRRPWELDMLPLVISAAEWRRLSAAVAQRAEVLDRVLADLYGPQRLLIEGLLPPALVFGQHGYQWPCHGIAPAGGRHLHFYAVDLARAPDGSWWVIADRTQGPSGAGYALQNRVVVSQAFPDAFRNLRVHKLASFFRSLQDGMARMAPTDGEAPLCVLLTPGPYNETYFEHAFLARYLGFPLVEGQDLTVRNDTVYLKTLRGLRRVHAILRRLDDDFCDPLELRADSALGVPGLLGAVRAGRVLMANGLGSGVLESAALFGFLPGICERLLGQPLAIPSVASWWCGETAAMEHVLAHIDELVIKPAYPDMNREPVFGHTLKGEALQRMVDGIVAQPHAYVGQEWVRLSQAPVWSQSGDQERLLPRSVGLRMFAAATPDGYVVMPGALTRVAPEAGVEVISMQRGGLSKDTWIQSDGPVLRGSLLKKRLGMIDLMVAGTEVPSRVGENLFWMGRHSERCEASARLLRTVLTRIATGTEDIDEETAGLLSAAERLGVLQPTAGDADLEERLLAAVSDYSRPGSIAANLRALGFNINHVRERLSSDNWHVLNRLENALRPAPTTLDRALGALDRVMLDCISLAGFAMDDMTRDEAWRFLILGRRIERLAALSTLIRSMLETPASDRERMLEWLLESCNSIVTYRARYRRTPELLPVLHLLVSDTSNPHSVAFQARALKRYLTLASQELGHAVPAQIDELERRITRFDLTAFEAEECDPACARLSSLLGDAWDTAQALSDDVHSRFFIHTVHRSRIRSGT
jgi:uncharacterized circularly permuted ATP-grasp superfamily protein/uncharacterized alpha-E superfamily protein